MFPRVLVIGILSNNIVGSSIVVVYHELVKETCYRNNNSSISLLSSIAVVGASRDAFVNKELEARVSKYYLFLKARMQKELCNEIKIINFSFSDHVR